MKAPKPKILILGSDLDYIDKQYYSQFKADYDVDVSTPPSITTRQKKTKHHTSSTNPFHPRS